MAKMEKIGKSIKFTPYTVRRVNELIKNMGISFSDYVRDSVQLNLNSKIIPIRVPESWWVCNTCQCLVPGSQACLNCGAHVTTKKK